MRYLSFITLLVLALALSRVAISGDDEKPAVITDPFAQVHGMTISCHGSGRSWGSDDMVKSMVKLRSMGVNWIAIHPYAGINPNGTVGGSPRRSRMYQDTTWLTRPIEEAHKLGLKIMIKPHIAYWGSPFSWRGEIAFETQEQWDRFFETYKQWITLVAELSKDADAFVVGTELGKTVHHEKQWREIISAVKQEFDGPLTYCANWDRYEQVPFWDALDVIALQSYFPLVNHTELPTSEELDGSWVKLIARLERFGKKHDRKILLGELGYNRSSQAALRPWESKQGGEQAEETQRRCLASALPAIDSSDWVVGAFLWKWFPGESGRGSFVKSTPTMRKVIKDNWATTE